MGTTRLYLQDLQQLVNVGHGYWSLQAPPRSTPRQHPSSPTAPCSAYQAVASAPNTASGNSTGHSYQCLLPFPRLPSSIGLLPQSGVKMNPYRCSFTCLSSFAVSSRHETRIENRTQPTPAAAAAAAVAQGKSPSLSPCLLAPFPPSLSQQSSFLHSLPVPDFLARLPSFSFVLLPDAKNIGSKTPAPATRAARPRKNAKTKQPLLNGSPRSSVLATLSQFLSEPINKPPPTHLELGKYLDKLLFLHFFEEWVSCNWFKVSTGGRDH